MKKLNFTLVSTLALFASIVANADGNPNNANDASFQLKGGQTAHIHWHNATIQSGPSSDNPFQLTVWNTSGGSDHPEDLKGTSPQNSAVPDFFKFEMTDMTMPDPASVYRKPRHIVRTGLGTYEVTNALFSMSSMQADDWRINVLISGSQKGSTDITVQ